MRLRKKLRLRKKFSFAQKNLRKNEKNLRKTNRFAQKHPFLRKNTSFCAKSSIILRKNSYFCAKTVDFCAKTSFLRKTRYCAQPEKCAEAAPEDAVWLHSSRTAGAGSRSPVPDFRGSRNSRSVPSFPVLEVKRGFSQNFEQNGRRAC